MKKVLKLFLIIMLLAVIIGCIILGSFVAEGYHLYQNALEKESLESRVNRIRSKSDYIMIAQIPVDFKNAIIAVEDHRFETHGAVDIISIGRAIFQNIINLSLIQGGSTITQQLAKNTLFTQEKKLTRKIAEVFAAIDFEKKYSKDEIIEMYMNTIYFGDGYYGINAASHGYFGKAPLQLSLDECTLLAGLPNAPSIYSLSTNPSLARQRQKQVINCMIEYRLSKF